MDFPMELLEVLLKFDINEILTLKIVTERIQKKKKKENRKNSCFTAKLEIEKKFVAIGWISWQVNYKFEGARYRSGSGTRNRIIPLVRDKLYANRS